MEGVPRMPMLSFELKTCSESIELTPALKSYISEAYHENPDNYSKECGELDQLRQSAVQVTMDFVGCSVLKRYFAQLHFLQSRFPMKHGDPVVIPFTWEDPYMHNPYTATDVEFEVASILYNIGALHSILGSMDSRTSAEGMKVSCTHFQCAAWAFQHLRDSYDSNASPDMNHQLLSFKSYLMLAQAQECILEKSMTDNRKSSITAKVSAQIVDYYKLAMKSFDASNTSMYIGSKKAKEWKKRMELKVNFYDCITFYYLGISAEEQQKWGERITYYQASVDKLTECSRLYGKGDADSASIGESIRFAMDVAAGKCTSAKKDNDFIYHEKIPTLDSLPDVKGASLVKGIPFNHNDPEVSGPDIFRKLVPIEAHKASSMYSEEKAKLLRQVTAKIEEKNQELSQFMSSIQLESVTQIVPEPQKLPQALVEKCAAISVRPDAIKSLTDAMQSLSGISLDVEGNIREIRALLDEEDKRNKEFQVVYGSGGVIKSSAALSEMNNECAKCQEGLTKASQSNEELHRAMEVHIANLRILASPLHELQAMLPSVSDLQRTPEDEAAIKDMRRLYDKVEEMKGQRQRLEQQLREELLKDDVTAVLVTQGDKNQEEFFQEQLNKHAKTVGFIDQNLSAQDNILRAFTDVNARFAHIRKENTNVVNRRDTKISELIKSYDVYEDLMTKTNRGVQFYSKLDSTVKRLLERTCSACKTCEEERSKILERLAPKAPPPARPTAPKPGQPQTSSFDAAIANFHVDMSGLPPAAFHQSMMPSAMPQMSAEPQPLRLKDFLPLMKPGSFGPKAPLTAKGSSGNGSASVPAGSLPGSISASPVHFAPSSGSLPASPHRQLLPNAEPTGAYNSENVNSGFLPSSDSSVQSFQISGVGFKHIMSNPSEEYASYSMQNSNLNMSGRVMDSNSAGQFVPSVAGSVSTVSSVADYSGASSHVVASGSGRFDYVYDSASGTSTGNTGPMHSTSASVYSGNDSLRTLNTQLAGTNQCSFTSPHGASLADAQFASSFAAYGNGSGQSFMPSNQGVPPTYNGLPVKPPYSGSSHTSLPASSNAASGYYSHTPATFPPTYAATSGGTYTGGSTGQPSFVNPSSHSVSGNNVALPQAVQHLQHLPQGLSNMPVLSSGSMPRHPAAQATSQFQSAVSASAGAQSQNTGTTYASAVPTSLAYNSAFQTNSQIQQQVPVSVHQQALNQATMPGANGLPVAPQNWYSSANQSASVGTFPGQYSHEHSIYNHATITSMSGQHQPPNSSGVSVTSVLGQQQPRYPSTAGGMPSNQQQGPGFSSVHQMPQRFPASNQQPSFQASGQTSSGYMANNNQPRYPVADQMLPPAAGQSQNDLRRQYPSDMQPEYKMTNVPATGNTWMSSSSQPMVQPPHSYQTGYQVSDELPYGYQSANQSTGVSQQIYPSGNSQNLNYMYANQAPSQTHSNSSQPAVSGGNFNTPSTYLGSIPGSMHVNYGQRHSSQSVPVQNQQQGIASVPNVYSAFPQNVSAAPTPYTPATSSVSDITPPSLPSPLQPSRVSSGAFNNFKNLESLKDLEITSAANTTASSSLATSEGQSVIGENTSSVDSTGTANQVGHKLAAPSLVPKVVSTEEQRERREEEARRTLHQSRSTRDPFADADVLARFAADVEKFQKLVDALVKPTLGGYLPLDKEWKDLNDEQERASKQCMAIARCYPLKNRYPDVMPYDNSRVVLAGAADDYINASHLESLSPSCPNFIATQSPLPTTFADFWQMVYDQGTETLVALCVELEAGVKNHVYWPVDKSQSITHGSFVISLQSIKDKQMWIERILSVTHKTTNQARSIVHLQFLSWPPAGIPDSVENLIQFVIGVQSFYLQQRSLTKPVIVHCSNGVGRTGAFCVIYAGINEIDQGNGIVQINEMISRMRRQRRSIVQYKEQLKFCYDTVLYYAQDMLRRRGLLNSRSTFGTGKLPSVGDRTHVRAPSDDLVLGLPSLSAIQSSVSKMSARTPSTRASSVDNSAVAAASTDSANPDLASKSDSSMPGSSDVVALAPVDHTLLKPLDDHSRASSPALSTCSGSESSLHVSPQHHCAPTFSDPKCLPSVVGPSLSNLPISLADLQNPATFRIDPSPSTKRKITKASFFDPARPSLSVGNDIADPLSQLDPLWSLKPADKDCVN